MAAKKTEIEECFLNLSDPEIEVRQVSGPPAPALHLPSTQTHKSIALFSATGSAPQSGLQQLFEN